MRTEWAVLADASRARIFARVGGGMWQDIRNLTRTGAGGDNNGRELRLPAGMERLNAAPVLASRDKDDFLERLARELCTARKRGDFERLVLIAPGKVLETLKDGLDMATRRTLTATADENLTNLPVRDARREISRRF